MKTINLEFDFLMGPIVKDMYSVSKNKLVTGIDLIDNDEELTILNEKASSLYSSFYEFDKDDLCNFNTNLAKEHANELLELINKIKSRINSLNDGSIVINDLATSQIKNF